MFFELYNHRVSNLHITNIMANLIKKAGTDGKFLSETIRNITIDLKDVMNEIAHVSTTFSVAESNIAKLNV